ncbi:MAG: hypothetical protein ACEPOZ_15715 [Marinifilaceae bacterium]
MRKITANYLYIGKEGFLKNGILVLDDENRIQEVIDTKGNFREIANLEYHSGIIVPGFVDCFCQLEAGGHNELFHKSMNIAEFYKQFNESYNQSDFVNNALVTKGLNQLKFYGTAACADFFSSEASISPKRNSTKAFLNFMQFSDETEEILTKQIKRSQSYKNEGMETFPFWDGYCINWNEYLNRSKVTTIAQSSVTTNLVDLKLEVEKRLVVWDSKKTDIPEQKTLQTFTVLPPRLYQFLYEELPALKDLQKAPNLCLGTGNLSVHKELSILEEMKCLQIAFPELSLEEILKWATLNGATALSKEKTLGSFDLGKQPGVNLITKVDLFNFKLQPESKVKVLV